MPTADTPTRTGRTGLFEALLESRRRRAVENALRTITPTKEKTASRQRRNRADPMTALSAERGKRFDLLAKATAAPRRSMVVAQVVGREARYAALWFAVASLRLELKREPTNAEIAAKMKELGESISRATFLDAGDG